MLDKPFRHLRRPALAEAADQQDPHDHPSRRGGRRDRTTRPGTSRPASGGTAPCTQEGRAAQVSGDSRHPYTEALLSAMPSLLERPERIVLHGPVPSATNPPSGCPFRTRCWKADDACATAFPAASDGPDGHRRHCVHPQPGNYGTVAVSTAAGAV